MEKLTHSELQVMKCIWDANEQLPLSAILKSVNERFDRNWRPQTASTFVARLVQKKFIRLDRSVRYYSYEVLISQMDYLTQTILDFADFWGDTIATTFMSTLIENQIISKEDASTLVTLLKSYAESN